MLRCLAGAAQELSEGDEAGAQQALDVSGLTRLSPDGAVLMRAVAGSLGMAALDLPWSEGPGAECPSLRMPRASMRREKPPSFSGVGLSQDFANAS